MKSFGEFEVWVGAGTGPSFPVKVDSPAGPADGSLQLDLADEQFNSDLARVRGVEPGLGRRQQFGRRLFEALFRGDVGTKLIESRARVDGGQADGLRLRLWIDPPELAALPWELLWDGKAFLATVANLALSRYLPGDEPPHLPPQDNLRILLVVASPEGMDPVPQQEIDGLEAAILELGDGVHLQTLRNASIHQIQHALQQDYHVFHFLGHGASERLFLVGKDRQRLPIGDEEFAQLFLGRGSLRLVVLNACESSQAEEGSLFDGMGPALVRKRLPAVVAMQYPFVLQDTAGEFSRAFYGALANGLPVDVAVNEGRQLLSAGPLLDKRDWSTPVLYLGTKSGYLLDLRRPEAADGRREEMVIEVGVLAAQVVSTILLPFVKEGAAKLAEKISGKAGETAAEQAVEVAGKVWDKVQAAFEGDPDKVTVDDFSEYPEDTEKTLIRKLTKKLEENPNLAKELQDLTETKESESGQTAVKIIADTVGYVDARGAQISGGITAGYIGRVDSPRPPGPRDGGGGQSTG